MEFKEEYTSTTKNEKDKTVLTDSEYVLCEILYNLTQTLERVAKAVRRIK